MSTSAPSAVAALWRGLCPACRKGRIFAGRWRMNATCPVCSLAFEREPGYFVGAILWIHFDRLVDP